MSLLHLIHQSVSIKFSEAAKDQFTPGVPYYFRLTGVDAMGFLQIQDLKENAPSAIWINKDLVRELQPFDPATLKEAPKPEKAKLPPKPKASKQKAVLN